MSSPMSVGNWIELQKQRITELEAEVARLREALADISMAKCIESRDTAYYMRTIAKAALRGGEGESK